MKAYLLRGVRGAVLALWLSTTLHSCMSPEKQAVKGVTINDSFKFRSAAEQNEARRKALAGNAEAAKRLGDLSLFVENNIVEAKRWYRLAASFGDKDAKESLRTLENLDRE